MAEKERERERQEKENGEVASRNSTWTCDRDVRGLRVLRIYADSALAELSGNQT